MIDPDVAIADLVASKSFDVPPYPGVAFRVNKLLQSNKYTMDDLARVIQADPSLAAQILRVANSAAMHPSANGVQTLTSAVGRIGAERTARIVLAACLGKDACAAGGLSELRYLAWRRCLCTGFIAQHLAPNAGANPDEAFLCGLLCGFGQTIAIAALEQLVSSHPEAKALPAERWMRAINTQQRTVGLLVAEKWQLPEVVREVIRAVGTRPTNSPHSRMTQLVGIAQALTNMLEQHPTLHDSDLAKIASDPGVRRRLVQFLGELPDLVDSLGSEKQAGAPAATNYVAADETTLVGELHPTFFKARTMRKQKNYEYEVSLLGPPGFVLQGVEPMQVNWLMKVEIQSMSGMLSLWGKVTQCLANNRSFRIEVQPFGITGPMLEAWRSLVEEASAQTAVPMSR